MRADSPTRRAASAAAQPERRRRERHDALEQAIELVPGAILGALLLLIALRQWRSRPAPGVTPEMPKWMAGIDAFSPVKSFTLALLLAGVNPKNLLLSAGAGAPMTSRKRLSRLTERFEVRA